jgi:hypothetical protein
VKIIVRVVLAATTVLAFAEVARDQEPQHAPTVQTCRADASLWYSDEMNIEYGKAEVAWLSEKVPNRTAIGRLRLTEVDARAIELAECFQVDTDQNDHYKYHQAELFYKEVASDRYFHFLVRHNLLEQLMREDKQGLR